MNRLKRLICALLALAMIASLALVSCGGGDETTAPPSNTPDTTAARTILETKTPAGTNFGGEKIKFLSRSDVDYYDEITVKADEIANVITTTQEQTTEEQTTQKPKPTKPETTIDIGAEW